jgi:uncharacterized protein (TIGR03435 family)
MVPSEIEDTPEEAMHAMRSFLVSQLPGPRPNVPGAVITNIADSFTIEELCRLLEQGVGRPVIDETRLTGRYAVNVQSEPVSARAFLQIVCDALGLVARVERRDIELLVLRPK